MPEITVISEKKEKTKSNLSSRAPHPLFHTRCVGVLLCEGVYPPLTPQERSKAFCIKKMRGPEMEGVFQQGQPQQI